MTAASSFSDATPDPADARCIVCGSQQTTEDPCEPCAAELKGYSDGQRDAAVELLALGVVACQRCGMDDAAVTSLVIQLELLDGDAESREAALRGWRA